MRNKKMKTELLHKLEKLRKFQSNYSATKKIIRICSFKALFKNVKAFIYLVNTFFLL